MYNFSFFCFFWRHQPRLLLLIASPKKGGMQQFWQLDPYSMPSAVGIPGKESAAALRAQGVQAFEHAPAVSEFDVICALSQVLQDWCSQNDQVDNLPPLSPPLPSPAV